MPTWWKKSSCKNKEEGPQAAAAAESPQGKLQPHKKKMASKSERAHKCKDEAALPRTSPSPSSSGFSGFDSDSVEKRGHPLPRPSVSDLGIGGGGVGLHGLGSTGSGSVASVRSSGSSGEDHTIGAELPSSQFGAFRGQGELKFNIGSRSPGPMGSRSPAPGSRSPGPGTRSPAPGSRATSRPTSPLHPGLEEGKSQCHRLPLPPSSPSSASQPSTRTNEVIESTPVTLSTWKKGKLLGRGTFGHVYLGFNSVSGQMCAIKEVRLVSDDQSSKECLKQLNQEINLLSQLSHPNIVRYYGSELSEETLSVYLEYVSGGSIHKLLQEYGPFKEPVIQNYTRQILAGLAYLHGRNTVHRDIKGANILVDPNGEIKLADFGMAKHITACSSMLSFKGSPYWMAPEVVMNTNGYSLPVDIWSLGCTVLEMASAKPPWSKYEGVAAIFKIGNSRDMPDIPDHLSNNAKDFIKLCLQRDPSLRPTAMQLLDHSFIRDQATMRSPGIMQLLDHSFVRDQATVRSPGISMTSDASPFAFDGSHLPTPLELHSNRPSNFLGDGDVAITPVITNARALKGPRDDVRMITSLPVSPSHKSCMLSPHTTYTMMAQTGYNSSDYSLYLLRPSIKYPLDPFYEPSILKTHTPGASPSRRPI